MAKKSVSLYEAKTHLSSLVEDAASGQSIVISKNGVPRAMLVPLVRAKGRRKPAHALEITEIAPDFDTPVPELPA